MIKLLVMGMTMETKKLESFTRQRLLDFALEQCLIYGEHDFSTQENLTKIDLKLTLLDGVQCWYKPSYNPFEWLPISGEEAVGVLDSFISDKTRTKRPLFQVV